MQYIKIMHNSFQKMSFKMMMALPT